MMADAPYFFATKEPPPPIPSAEVIVLAYQAFSPPPWNHTPEKVCRLLQRVYDKPKFFGVFAYREEGELVGMAMAATEVFQNKPPHFEFNTLCVDPAFHHGGVGRGLTQRIIEEAHVQNLPYVELNTLKDSAAEKLYAKLGFVVVPSAPKFPEWRVMRYLLSKDSTPMQA